MMIRPAVAFRAAEQVAKTSAKVAEHASDNLLKSFGVGCVTGGIVKSAGSIYRLVDDANAPKDVKTNTYKRESLTLVLTTLSSGAVRTGFDLATTWMAKSSQPKLREVAAKMAKNNSLITIPIIFFGSLIAEGMSRKVAPRDIWAKNGQMKSHPVEIESDDDDDDDDDDDKQINPAGKHFAAQSHDSDDSAEKKSIRKSLPLTFAQAGSQAKPATPLPHPYQPFNPFQGPQLKSFPPAPAQPWPPTVAQPSGFRGNFSL